MCIWTIAEVLEYVEHPGRKVRCGGSDREENEPFTYVNRLGKILSQFSREDQIAYLDNFIDTLDQI